MLISDAQVKAWLQQFHLGDRLLAQKLLKAFTLVSRDDFAIHMRTMLIREAEGVDGKVALYTERELRHRHGVPHRLFKEPRRKIRRAIGAQGPEAVKPTAAYDPSVGSEGIIAQIVSELCKEFPKKFLNHPGPEQIRQKQARAFWVVTDLLGTGNRAWRYLEAAWLVRSVRSWRSGKLMEFAVMSYSATEMGEHQVRRHKCQPQIKIVQPCPTIDTTFSKKVAAKMKKLCTMYDPTVREADLELWEWGKPSSLGYGSTGALIVFAHGAPNNIPLMFYKASQNQKNSWTPLFPARVSAGINKDAFGVDLNADQISTRLNHIGQRKLARSTSVLRSDIPTAHILLVLGSLSHPARLNDRVLANITRLPMHILIDLLDKMVLFGWVDSQRRLTDQGAGQLAHAKKQLYLAPEVAKNEPGLYYPKALRRPI